MSFHEKNAWACLVSLLLVFVPYFVFVLRNPVAYIWLFILAVVVLGGLLTAFNVINASLFAVNSKSGELTQLDERDKTIEVRAAKISGLVLGFAVVTWCLNTMIGVPIIGKREWVDSGLADGNSLSDYSIPAETVLMAIHLLFAGFVIANLVYYLAIIVGYRRAS